MELAKRRKATRPLRSALDALGLASKARTTHGKRKALRAVDSARAGLGAAVMPLERTATENRSNARVEAIARRLDAAHDQLTEGHE
ncbi:MAG: hypothetical protein WB565_03770 [Acidimicrobiales bacterium]